MARERKPKQVVLYVELEDNVGFVLGKKIKEVKVNVTSDLAPHQLAEKFEQFVNSLPAEIEV